MMFLRFSFLLFVIVLFNSCDKFSFSKSNKKQAIDTVVDFSSVDMFPSFKDCNPIIDKDKKAACFRETIHQKIGAELLKHQFTIKDAIDELVYVDVLINSNGEFLIAGITSSQNIKDQIPKLDSLLIASIQSLPKVYPAIKRGIPVTTKYRLPVKIQLQE